MWKTALSSSTVSPNASLFVLTNGRNENAFKNQSSTAFVDLSSAISKEF